MKLDLSHLLTGLLVFSLAFLPAVVQRLPPDSLATAILGGAYAGLIGLAAWLNTSPAPVAVASAKAGVRRVFGLAPLALLVLLVVALVAACLTPAQRAIVSADTADVVDLTNAACAVAEPVVTVIAPPDGGLVTLACDVVDATGAIVEHLVTTVPAAKAAAIVRRHPRVPGTTAAESVLLAKMQGLSLPDGGRS